MNLLAANIEKLHGIIEPVRVEFTPVTIGWYLLAILTIILFIFITIQVVNRFNKRKYRRIAKCILVNEIAPVLYDEHQFSHALTKLNSLLKSVAIQSYSREEVASLYGNDWIEFMHLKHHKTNFTDSNGTNLLEQQYKLADNPHNIDKQSITQLIYEAKKWIGGHRV